MAQNVTDPRIARTRAQVLTHARILVEEGGSEAVNYSVLASRSGVTRPTLYRHWPTLPALLRDLVPEVTTADKFRSGDSRQKLVDYLKEVRREVSDPGNAGVFLALMDLGEHDNVARDTLKTVVGDRTRVINKLLQGTGNGTAKAVSNSDVAQLLGPLVFCRFVQRATIGNALIDRVVDSWLAGRR